jgi:hypothetical protein
MRTVSPDALNVPTFPILTAEVKTRDFREHFPIRMTALHPLAEAEPSEGALVRLKSGDVVHLTFGKKTGTLSVSAPANSNVRVIIENLIAEARIDPRWITWSKVRVPSRSAIHARRAAAKGSSSRSLRARKAK